MKKLLAIAAVAAMIMASTGVNAKTGMMCAGIFSRSINNTTWHCNGNEYKLDEIYSMGYRVVGVLPNSGENGALFFIEKD